MGTIRKHAEENTTPTHGLKGPHKEESNSSDNNIMVTMINHFEMHIKKSTPQATQLIKVMGGGEMCDDNNNLCKLRMLMLK